MDIKKKKWTFPGWRKLMDHYWEEEKHDADNGGYSFWDGAILTEIILTAITICMVFTVIISACTGTSTIGIILNILLGVAVGLCMDVDAAGRITLRYLISATTFPMIIGICFGLIICIPMLLSTILWLSAGAWFNLITGFVLKLFSACFLTRLSIGLGFSVVVMFLCAQEPLLLYWYSPMPGFAALVGMFIGLSVLVNTRFDFVFTFNIVNTLGAISGFCLGTFFFLLTKHIAKERFKEERELRLVHHEKALELFSIQTNLKTRIREKGKENPKSPVLEEWKELLKQNNEKIEALYEKFENDLKEVQLRRG